MAFYDISVPEQRQVSARERAFQEKIAGSVGKGISEGMGIRAKEKEREAKIAREDQLIADKGKRDRAKWVEKMQLTMAEAGFSLPEGSEDSFREYVEKNDSTKIQPIFNSMSDYVRGQKEKELQIKREQIQAEPRSLFTKELIKQSAKDFQKEVEALKGADKKIAKIDDTVNKLLQFEKESLAGTGPVGQYISSPLVSRQAEDLDRRFKDLQLDKMKEQFAGMSKAIDSDAERKFFMQSQASLGNRPETNLRMLLGSKSIALKQKAETAAKQNHLAQNPDLTNYVSPVIGVLTTVIDQDGEMQLIPVESLEEAQRQGFFTVDQYAENILRKTGDERRLPAFPEAQAAHPTFNLDPIKQQRYLRLQELERKSRGE